MLLANRVGIGLAPSPAGGGLGWGLAWERAGLNNPANERIPATIALHSIAGSAYPAWAGGQNDAKNIMGNHLAQFSIDPPAR